MRRFDNRGFGWIIAGVVVQWIGLLFLLILGGMISSRVDGAGGLVAVLIIFGILEVSLCTYGASQLNKGNTGWITFFLIYSIIGGVMTLIRGGWPVAAVLFLIGAIILKGNNE